MKYSALNVDLNSVRFDTLGSRSPPCERIKFGYPLENVRFLRFLLLSTNLARQWLQIDTDLLHRNEMSPLTHGLNYRSACDITIRFLSTAAADWFSVIPFNMSKSYIHSKIPQITHRTHGDSSQSPYPYHTHTHGNPHTHGSPEIITPQWRQKNCVSDATGNGWMLLKLNNSLMDIR